MTSDDIEQAVLRAINSHPSFNSESHDAHHKWLEERIELERSRKELYKSIASSVAQWSVVGILGAISYWVQSHFNWQ